MQIEIVTTKKKLTMAIVKQMAMASINDIRDIVSEEKYDKVLGYINEFPVGKSYKIPVIILHNGKDWKYFPCKSAEPTENQEYSSTGPDGNPLGSYMSRKITTYGFNITFGSSLKYRYTYGEDKDKRDTSVAAINKLVDFAKNTHIYI